MSARSAFIEGSRAVLPVVIGVFPFGIVSGVVAIEAGMPPEAAIGMSLFIFAGASQVAAAQLYSVNSPAWIIVLTATIVNLRMLMYSAALAPYFQKVSLRWRALVAYLLTDQAFALTVARHDQQREEPNLLWYYLGCALTLWLPWQFSTAIGVFIGTRVPPELSLEFAAPLSFIAIWIPGLKDRPLIVAALVSGATAVSLHFLPNRLWLIVGALAGIIAGYWAEARQK